jgi:nitrogen fixation protein
MGINYSGGMIVGQLGEELEIEDLYELIDVHDLDVFYPYYDADLEESIIGVRVASCWGEDVLDQLVEEVKALITDLRALGFDNPKLYGKQNIT